MERGANGEGGQAKKTSDQRSDVDVTQSSSTLRYNLISTRETTSSPSFVGRSPSSCACRSLQQSSKVVNAVKRELQTD